MKNDTRVTTAFSLGERPERRDHYHFDWPTAELGKRLRAAIRSCRDSVTAATKRSVARSRAHFLRSFEAEGEKDDAIEAEQARDRDMGVSVLAVDFELASGL